MWDVANCDIVGAIFLGDDIDFHSKSGVWKHMEMKTNIGSDAIVESLQHGEKAFLCCNWNPTSSSID